MLLSFPAEVRNIIWKLAIPSGYMTITLGRAREDAIREQDEQLDRVPSDRLFTCPSLLLVNRQIRREFRVFRFFYRPRVTLCFVRDHHLKKFISGMTSKQFGFVRTFQIKLGIGYEVSDDVWDCLDEFYEEVEAIWMGESAYNSLGEELSSEDWTAAYVSQPK